MDIPAGVERNVMRAKCIVQEGPHWQGHVDNSAL